MELLKSYLQKISPVTDQEWVSFSSQVTSAQYQKNDFFCQVGQGPDTFGFIDQGLFKLSYIKEDGKEAIKLFSSAGHFIGPYANFLKNTKSNIQIQALTESTVFKFNSTLMVKLSQESKNWETCRRVLAEMHYVLKEDREYQFMILDAAARYEKFLEEYKEYIHLIPDYHIANYLNVSASYLSTLRKSRKS